MIEKVIKELEESANIKRMIAQNLADKIANVAEILIDAYKAGGKVLLIGNGGSAADAQHIAAELIGRFKLERKGLPAIALTTNTSILTALANDYGYDTVFSRQLEALANDKDVLIAFTTSGTSPNILKAIEVARSKNVKVIGLTGGDGGKLKDVADITIVVPSDNTPRIQEAHITIGHIICNLVERGCLMNRAVFLDRDGVITQDPPHYAHRLDQLKLIRKSAEAIRLLNENEFKVIVVSNQSGVAKGYYQEKDVGIFNRAIEEELKKEGAYIDAIYYCPHHPDAGIEVYRIDCDCRKPKPGMLLKAAQELNINLKQSFMVGDKRRDIEAGCRAGCKTILVLTGHGGEESSKNKIEVDFISVDLYEGVKNIVLNKINR